MLYWTDRGNPPVGNKANRSQIDVKMKKRQAQEILLTHLQEGIGISLSISKGNECS
jgi:hypothetical protein